MKDTQLNSTIAAGLPEFDRAIINEHLKVHHRCTPWLPVGLWDCHCRCAICEGGGGIKREGAAMTVELHEPSGSDTDCGSVKACWPCWSMTGGVLVPDDDRDNGQCQCGEYKARSHAY